ncbi:MAG: methyl-accepting chemotaxis protein [Burkholderiaceae bacterium]
MRPGDVAAQERGWRATIGRCWRAWREYSADPAIAACLAVCVLLLAALAQLGWSAARAGQERAGDFIGIERDHRVRAITRVADDATAALGATVSSSGWKSAAAGLEKAAARLDAAGEDLAAIAAGLDADRDRDDGRAAGASAAADYRWAVGELRSVLAPLLASASIDSLRVVRRADGRVLHDSTGESIGRLVPEIPRILGTAGLGEGMRVLAYPMLGASPGGLVMVASEGGNGPLVLGASVALANVASDSGTRITLVDGNGRMRSWQYGRTAAVSEEAARLYRASLAATPDPDVELAVARLRIAGAPLTLIVEPAAGGRASGWAAFAWPALLLVLVAGLAMAWLWRRVRGTPRRSPATVFGDSTLALDETDDGAALDDSVIAIMRAVGRIATSRDLTIRVPVTEDVTGAISDALNLLTEETGRAFREVGVVSGDVARATIAVRGQGQRAAEAARTELREVDLAAQELAAAARALTGVAELARRVDRSAALAVAANAAAAAGVERTGEGVTRARDLIRDTEKQVKRLGERSQEIGQVVALIRSISERTGILALNASIQAATQREQGRGFGSVADEVKRLSGTTRESTERITHLVAAIQTDAAQTVAAMSEAIAQVIEVTRLSQQAGEQMNSSRDRTRRLAADIRSIARTTERQARASTVLKDRADRIRGSSAQTAAALEAQAEETQRLAESARRLLAAVSTFRVDP